MADPQGMSGVASLNLGGVGRAQLRYIVQPGDTLWLIAKTVLGTPYRWREIFDLNVGLRMSDGIVLLDHDDIRPGWELLLPQRLQAIETDMWLRLEAHFQKLYPLSYAKWCSAEYLLRTPQADGALTTIGHLSRETLQIFASELLSRHAPGLPQPPKNKDVATIKAVLGARRQSLGKTKHQFLEALLAYWGCVSDLAQRQEHGAENDGQSLNWDDARRLVFYTGLVLYEYHCTLDANNVSPRPVEE